MYYCSIHLMYLVDKEKILYHVMNNKMNIFTCVHVVYSFTNYH